MLNYFKTFMLMVLMMSLFVLVGRCVGGTNGMIYGLLFAAVLNLGAYWFSDKLVLKMHGAKEVSANDEPHLFRSVQKLSQAGNLPMPKVYVIETEAANAFATGRNLKNSAVAATRGILDLLSPAELEAVFAHELSHIKHRDILIGTVAAIMAGAIMMIGDMARWAVMLGGYSSRDDERGANPIGFILLVVLAPLAAVIIQMMISRTREYAADAGGSALTGNPLALARALKKIEASSLGLPLEAASPATAHLYIINPFDRESWLVNLFSTHPTVGRRVKKLEAFSEGRAKPVF